MTIQEMQERKRELGFSNEYLSKLSGVPVPTIQKIFSGTTKAPRQATIKSLEEVLSWYPAARQKLSSDEPAEYHIHFPSDQNRLSEAASAYAVQKRPHTIEEIYALPEGVHAELMDGHLYFMATPTTTHQRITGELHLIIANYIRSHGGNCEVFVPHFGVFLYEDDSTYLEPDLTIVCDPDKIQEKGCVGAPDWVIEILSPSTAYVDCVLKLTKYRSAGVREYWIIDSKTRTIAIYLFDPGETSEQVLHYSFEDQVPCSLYPDLSIRIADFIPNK